MNPKTNITNTQNLIKDISPSFCLAKWHHVTIYLQTGETHSCYHPPPHKIPLDELEKNPSALHNTIEKKNQRKQMLDGHKPSGCQYCWNIEALGSEYISDRHERNASIYSPQRLAEIKNNPWDFNINPEYIEISFGNECNFKCGYCHPKASSSYYNEIEKFGPYQGVSNHRQDIDWFKIYHKEETNPYVRAWWEWWPTVSQTLNILRITGGEPLLQTSTWQLLDDLSKNPKPNLELNINSNLGVKPVLVERLCNKINHLLENKAIKSFKLFTSMDTWGKKAEYIRNGLDLTIWEKNFHHYMQNTSCAITFMITFNIFSVTSFGSLLQKLLEWRKLYSVNSKSNQWQRLRFDTPHLKEPLQYDMNILPKDEFLPFMHEHLAFMQNNCQENCQQSFSVLEVEKFKRIVKYMETTNYDLEKIKQGRIDFCNWFNEHDRRRNTNLLDIFPELESFHHLCLNAIK